MEKVLLALLSDHFIEYLLWLKILSPIREKAFYAFTEMKTCLECPL